MLSAAFQLGTNYFILHACMASGLSPRNHGDDDDMAALGLNPSPQLCITSTRERNKAACCLFHSPAVTAVDQSLKKKLHVIALVGDTRKEEKKRPRGVSLRKRGVKIGDFAPCIFSPQVQSSTQCRKWIVQNFSAKPANKKKRRAREKSQR